MSALDLRPSAVLRGAPSATIGALVAGVLLGLQVATDPATGVTFSTSPFTDEGWSVLGARNQVLLGRWATDEWVLFWVQLPFNLVMAAVFELFGVGIIQARLTNIACSVVAVGLLSWLVGRRYGEVGGVVAGIGAATCGLLLYYGRLALLEPMVVLFLVAGFVLLVRSGRRGIVAVAAGTCFALAVATKASSVAAVFGILVGTMVGGGVPSPGMWRRTLVAGATCAVLVGGLTAVIVAQPGVIGAVARIWPDATPPSSIADAVARISSYPSDSDGALGMTAPLAVGSVVGVVLLAGRWRSLTVEQRGIAGGAIGWLVLGMGVLLLADYRPNRYVVPMVPPLAILTGCGAAIAVSMARARFGARAPLAVAAVLSVLVAVPGIAMLGSWTARATYRLPEIQADVHRRVSDGRAIQGAVTMAMRVPVPTLIVQPNVNAGDLYESHGVRWLLTNRDMTPPWAELHAAAWAAREVLVCYPWPSGEACLIRVP